MRIRPKQIAPEGAALGQVITWDGTKWAPATPASGSSAVIQFGNNNVSTTLTTRYLTPFLDDGLAETTPYQMDMPRAGTLRKLYIRHNIPAGNANLIVYTLRKNNVATALAVSLASTGTVGSDLVNAVAVAQGDVIDIEVTKAAAIGVSPKDIVATLEFV